MIAPPVTTVRIALVFVLLTSALAGSSAAQTQVESITQLPEVLEIGNVVYVEDDSGRRTKGRLLHLSGASLILESGREQRRFPTDQLMSVSQVDSKRDGFWIGFATGALPGVLLGLAGNGHCYNEGGDCAGPLVAGFAVGGTLGAVGGWIGAAIDGLNDSETLVFAKPRASATRIHLTPQLSRRGPGLALSLRF